MKTYRCAIIGCGARGLHQGEVLRSLPELELVACCDPRPERLELFRETLGVPGLYTDLGELLAAERIDLAHVMTHPNVRVEPVLQCARAGVAALSMEKPLALCPSVASALAQVARETGCRMAVNHQRRYMPYVQGLREVVASGRLGPVRTVRASTHGATLLTMGPHLIDLLLMLLGEPDPTQVWATSQGVAGFSSDIFHDAPEQTLAQILFPGPTEVMFVHGQENTVETLGDSGMYTHLELDLWGTTGWAWYVENRQWGYQTHRMSAPITGLSSFNEHHEAAQAEFTRALPRWIEDPAAEHECSLERSLRGFWILMAMLKSSLTGRPWRPGEKIEDGDLTALRELLARREG